MYDLQWLEENNLTEKDVSDYLDSYDWLIDNCQQRKLVVIVNRIELKFLSNLFFHPDIKSIKTKREFFDKCTLTITFNDSHVPTC